MTIDVRATEQLRKNRDRKAAPKKKDRSTADAVA
jgi:hypothetical protein